MARLTSWDHVERLSVRVSVENRLVCGRVSRVFKFMFRGRLLIAPKIVRLQRRVKQRTASYLVDRIASNRRWVNCRIIDRQRICRKRLKRLSVTVQTTAQHSKALIRKPKRTYSLRAMHDGSCWGYSPYSSHRRSIQCFLKTSTDGIKPKGGQFGCLVAP